MCPEITCSVTGETNLAGIGHRFPAARDRSVAVSTDRAGPESKRTHQWDGGANAGRWRAARGHSEADQHDDGQGWRPSHVLPRSLHRVHVRGHMVDLEVHQEWPVVPGEATRPLCVLAAHSWVGDELRGCSVLSRCVSLVAVCSRESGAVLLVPPCIFVVVDHTPS